jgi:transposase
MNVHLAKFIMYYDAHKLNRDGYSVSKISQLLGLNRRTVAKYLAMSEQEYENFQLNQSDRKKELLPYESFIRERLSMFRDTSAAQMHDWLKEHHTDFPKVNPKTVFNFVHWVRNKHNLPVVATPRHYEVVEELPYGKQAQVDFGEYTMRTSSHSNVKVFFFVMMLARSRYKFIWFTNRYFTSELAVHAHELAFEYFRGVPDEIVYDQDKVLLVSENKGDLILTDIFRAYMRDKSFKLHFCRRSDPESKGKVENVVKYVKINFLYNRTFYNIETLNDDVLGWMGRTANALPHAFTQKEPVTEWHIEISFLKPHVPHTAKAAPMTYTVRKDNTISWKGNLYSLPWGTYTGRGCMVSVRAEQDTLLIFDPTGNHPVCTHRVPTGRGIKVINTDHKRDKSGAIDTLILHLCNRFDNLMAAKEWLDAVRAAKSRYSRDQLLLIAQVLDATDPVIANKAMIFCHQNNVHSAVDFKAIVDQELRQSIQVHPQKIVLLNPLSGIKSKAHTVPEKSAIDDYQKLIKP